MRLFFALALDHAARQATADVSDQIARRLSKIGAGGAVKWVARENLHVTLRFLGEVADAEMAGLVSAVEAPLAVKPFEMVLGGGGCFPGGGAARVVWVGITQGADEARRIYDELDGRLAVLDVEREARGYTPHLTLGRVREISRSAAASLRTWAAEIASPIARVPVSTVTLFRSRLSPKGPAYESLLEVPLSGVTARHAGERA
jgi:2'-5' RNA ligase